MKIIDGISLSYDDLGKVAPKEFQEFHQEVESMMMYLKLNEINISFEKLLVYLSLENSERSYSRYGKDVEIVIQKLKPYYEHLNSKFLENTGVRMWFKYDPSTQKISVGWCGVLTRSVF
jgi:hypothetical protein